MSPDELDLALRKERLLERISHQRSEWPVHSAGLRRLCAGMDGVQAGVDRLKAHPEWSIGALLVFAVLKPRRFLRWSQRAWLGWRAYRNLRDRLSGWFGHG